MKELTLSALRCVTTTTCGVSPSLTVRVTNSFKGSIRPPTSAAHPRPKTRLQMIFPLLESIPKTFPNGVAATMICLKPNASRESEPASSATEAEDDKDAYDPVANRLAKLMMY